MIDPTPYIPALVGALASEGFRFAVSLLARRRPSRALPRIRAKQERRAARDRRAA